MDERLTALGPGTQSSMIGEPPPSPTMRPEGRPSVSWMVGTFSFPWIRVRIVLHRQASQRKDIWLGRESTQGKGKWPRNNHRHGSHEGAPGFHLRLSLDVGGQP